MFLSCDHNSYLVTLLFRLLGLNMLRVYRQARLATMTIIGRTETVSDELPGDSHAAPEAVEITTA